MSPMQTVHETRKARLLLLKKKHGSWANINKLIGWESTNARLSQIGAGSIRSGRNTPYVMGDEMAREIETSLGLETGWMDTPLTWADMHGQEDPRAKVMQLMEAMPADQWATAVRLLDALAQPAPANGTTGH
ncbi:MAG: hypothetical protein WBK26_17005 [Burkholderiaceae bacterium]